MLTIKSLAWFNSQFSGTIMYLNFSIISSTLSLILLFRYYSLNSNIVNVVQIIPHSQNRRVTQQCINETYKQQQSIFFIRRSSNLTEF